MVEKKEDRQVRIKIKILEGLDNLEFVKRKDSYSQTIQTLLEFYENKNGKRKTTR